MEFEVPFRRPISPFISPKEFESSQSNSKSMDIGISGFFHRSKVDKLSKKRNQSMSVSTDKFYLFQESFPKIEVMDIPPNEDHELKKEAQKSPAESSKPDNLLDQYFNMIFTMFFARICINSRSLKVTLTLSKILETLKLVYFMGMSASLLLNIESVGMLVTLISVIDSIMDISYCLTQITLSIYYHREDLSYDVVSLVREISWLVLRVLLVISFNLKTYFYVFYSCFIVILILELYSELIMNYYFFSKIQRKPKKSTKKETERHSNSKYFSFDYSGGNEIVNGQKIGFRARNNGKKYKHGIPKYDWKKDVPKIEKQYITKEDRLKMKVNDDSDGQDNTMIHRMPQMKTTFSKQGVNPSKSRS